MLNIIIYTLNICFSSYILIKLNSSYLVLNILVIGFIIYAGQYIFDRCLTKNNFKKNSLFRVVWQFKILLAILLVNSSWLPMIFDESNGYDPIRFYRDANDFVESGWSFIVPSNYQGAIYYYSGIFFIFGHNPVITAIINSFITLIASISIFNLLLKNEFISRNRNSIIFIILIPEIIWYDAITSRESLVSAIVCLTYYYTQKLFNNRSLIYNIIIILLLLSVLAIRTTVAISLCSAMLISFFFCVSNKNKWKNVIKYIVISIILFSLAPTFQSFIGGSELNLFSAFSKVQSYEDNIASELSENWSQNSIGLLLTPNNLFEAIIFTPIRMLLYIVSPLPNIQLAFSDAQQFLTMLTSLAYIYFLPYIIGGSYISFKKRYTSPEYFSIYIFLFIIFLTVAGGNIIIHERYRVMFSILYFSSAYIGLCNIPRSNIRYLQYYSYAPMLFLAGTMFFYKIL